MVKESETASSAGIIVSIQRSPGSRRPMQPVNPARVIRDFGLEEDRHARAGSERQILLIEEETLQAMNLSTGDVKENLTTRGIALTGLDNGSILQIGSEVRLRITKPCLPCSRMDEIRAGLQRELDGRRGMLARVESGGSISVGDPIRIL
ncbi:MAG: MOSC domain-containing protein [Acidobacteria bacterium]|nr:MOSC domain-containing protein [Acidobacteriota bacterium]